MEPRQYAEQAELAVLPSGDDERFNGYGVMGLPFVAGHVLGLRRFPVSSVGPGYRSVWHRAPDGAWTFYADVEPQVSCSRFFGSALAASVQTPIEISWPGPRQISVRVRSAGIEWEAEMASTTASRALNAVAGVIPERLWRNRTVLSLMAAVAGPALGAGRLGMHGRSPNVQWFIANPRVIWTIPRSDARIAGESLGPVGALREQARLGDFWIPQRGLCAIGRAFFEPFDVRRHRPAVATNVPSET